MGSSPTGGTLQTFPPYVLAIAVMPSGNLPWLTTRMLVFAIMLLSGILFPPSTLDPTISVVDVGSDHLRRRRCPPLFAGDFSPCIIDGCLRSHGAAVSGLTLSTSAMERRI